MKYREGKTNFNNNRVVEKTLGIFNRQRVVLFNPQSSSILILNSAVI